ncbi:NfeD family protein [uncultured Alistipes sp.]|jgi:membrane-bound ClpP family serine protease|uniref:NfeD family protein n=1 Tax=uncultured Alistipes sp. TaxID=538949 RepID=UPI00261D581D|nr:NfeD family protein [uncultured Alistipes sp.]
MELLLIIALILFGVLFLVAELVLLPGVSVGGILSLICFGSSIYMAFHELGTEAGITATLVCLVLAAAATVLSLRSKTWQRFSLRQKIASSSMPAPAEENIRPGDRGVTLSRLAPAGKIEIQGRIYEARSLDSYVDPRTPVEVVGFENFTIIVKTVTE